MNQEKHLRGKPKLQGARQSPRPSLVRLGLSLIDLGPDDFNEDALPPAPVKFAVKNLLPRPKI